LFRLRRERVLQARGRRSLALYGPLLLVNDLEDPVRAMAPNFPCCALFSSPHAISFLLRGLEHEHHGERRTPWELERRRTEHEHHSGRSHIHVSHSLCPSIPPLAGHGPRRVHRPGRVHRVPRAPPPPAATGPPTSALPSRSTNPTATAASPPPRRASGRDAATAAAE